MTFWRFYKIHEVLGDYFWFSRHIFHDLEMINLGVFNHFHEEFNISMTLQEKPACFIVDDRPASLKMTREMNIHQNSSWHKRTVDPQKTQLYLVFTENARLDYYSSFQCLIHNINVSVNDQLTDKTMNQEHRNSKLSFCLTKYFISSSLSAKQTFQPCDSEHFVQSHHRWQKHLHSN